MPKRIVHGERVWRSTKLANVQPEAFRAELANLIPCALANGTFECDPQLIWSQVYSFNRRSMTLNKVRRLLDELERVGILFRWNGTDGRVWGYWVGIKDGNVLPKPSEVKRGDYPIGEEPPPDLLDRFLSNELDSGLMLAVDSRASRDMGLGVGVGVGVGVGSGEGVGSGIGGEGMSESTRVKIINNTRELPNSSTSTDLKALLNEITFISDLSVIPDAKQAQAISNWLADYTPEEILDAFRRFYDDVTDDFQLKFAAKNFVEKGPYLIEGMRRIKLERVAEEELRARQRQELEAEVARKEEERKKRQQEEHELIETTLPSDSPLGPTPSADQIPDREES